MTRVKTVFSSSQCAHVWAQCSQDVGRNAGNSVSFVGRLFYSYSTPIAHILDTARGERVALVSAEGYSMTTKSKHLTAVRRAVRDNVAADFTVPYIDINSRGRYSAPRGCDMYEHGTLDVRDTEKRLANMHEANFAWLCSQYYQEANKLMHAQVAGFNEQYAAERLSHLSEQAHRYAHHFGLPCRRSQLNPIDTMRPIIERIERLRSDPKRKAKAEAREAARERARLAKAAQAYEEQARRNAERIQAFRAGVQNVGYVSDASGCAMLRLANGGNEIQTSWGASVPREHAERVLRFYDIVRARNPQYPFFPTFPGTATRDEYTLGHFKLDEIRADGSIKCGCHTITAQEIELLRMDICAEPVAG